MIDHETLVRSLGLIVVVSPFLMLVVLGIATLFGRPLQEEAIGRLGKICTFSGLVASLIMLATMLAFGTRYEPISLGSWVEIPHYHFDVKFVFDRLSVPFVILSFLLCGTIGAFANRYMHRERGFNRFFVFYSLFLLGMVVASLAGTIETLFMGWELVGLSSAMLVGFYHERPSPVRNGLRVWAVYRASDAALLLASVAMHHLRGKGDFNLLLGGDPWPGGVALVTASQAFGVGLLLLIAAAGKSALVPFSGWLPRAMEGPTPSSAVFYGALSVHLGAFLLLRMSPLLDASPTLRGLVIAAGAVTTIYAAFAGRVQTDIKSALCFASLTQVGLIVVEIGLGLQYLALIHILGHACMRTLQFLRAPSILFDYQTLENAIGSRLPPTSHYITGRLPNAWHLWFYRLALEKGYLDALLSDYLVRPVLWIFRCCDTAERRWTDFLSGAPSREPERDNLIPGPVEDLL